MMTPKHSKRFLFILLGILSATLAGCAWLDHKQGDWIFRPTQANWGGFNPEVDKFEDVWLTHPNGEKIHAWYIPTTVAKKNAPTLLYLHGARWNLSGSTPRLKRWASWGYNVFAIDYRGFGKSAEGTPSEKKAYEDARLAWAWMSAREPDANKRFIFGHSLGGAIAIDLAVDVKDEAGVIVEATFTNMREIAATTAAKILPLDALLTQRFDTMAKIDKINSPLLITHGSNDSLIPVDMSRQLFAQAKEPKQLVIVDGASHHSVSSQGATQYQAAMQQLKKASVAIAAGGNARSPTVYSR